MAKPKVKVKKKEKKPDGFDNPFMEKFFNDNDLIFDYQSGNLEERIKQVCADNMLDALILVDESTDVAFLELTLEQAWQALPADSLNHQNKPDNALLYHFSDDNLTLKIL